MRNVFCPSVINQIHPKAHPGDPPPLARNILSPGEETTVLMDGLPVMIKCQRNSKGRFVWGQLLKGEHYNSRKYPLHKETVAPDIL
jgi:hypothetical protein